MHANARATARNEYTLGENGNDGSAAAYVTLVDKLGKAIVAHVQTVSTAQESAATTNRDTEIARTQAVADGELVKDTSIADAEKTRDKAYNAAARTLAVAFAAADKDYDIAAATLDALA